MQIGIFAKICGTTITLLRHYDKAGVLIPDYIDRFTGYRYYSPDQVDTFVRINALKKAGFSLAEIKKILSSDTDSITPIFEKKKNELLETLENIEEAIKIMSKKSVNTNFSAAVLNEDTNIPFENDESLVGKWKIIGEFASKEVFLGDMAVENSDYHEKIKEIYFLPDGERYWIYGWSKGKLIIETGDCSAVNDFTVEKIDGRVLMFVSLKSYEYRQTGIPTTLVLEQLDNIHYTKDEISRKDDVSIPFADDEKILGKWCAFAYCRNMEAFDPDDSKLRTTNLFFSEAEFKSEGRMRAVYGKTTVENIESESWTRGFILKKINPTSCAYEIREIGGVEYLFIEWKSGDYIWGGFDPTYYVFVRG